MARNMSQAARMLARVGFNIESINKPNGMTYKILHKARPLIFLPIQAVDNNVIFLADTAQKFVQTSDGKTMEVKDSKMVNIIDTQEEIEATYKMTWYQFAEKWHKSIKGLHMLDFFRLELEEVKTKEENNGKE